MYENLLEQEITRPLGMTETVVTMQPELRLRICSPCISAKGSTASPLFR